MATITTEQYLALSQFAYNNFNASDVGEPHATISWLIDNYPVEHKGDPQFAYIFSLLDEIGDWKLIGFQPNTSSNRSNPVDGRTLIQLFHKIAEWLGLPQITLHEIRHSVASLLFQRGIPAKTAQNILGHKSIVTTLQVYTHSTPEQRVSAMTEIAGIYDKPLNEYAL